MATILVLEDDPFLSDLICHSIVDAGYEAIICTNATTALEQFEHHQIDLVVADLIIKEDGRLVPDGGYSLISRLRAKMWFKKNRLPIIAISGLPHYPGLRSALDTAKSIGADASLTKPFSPAELLDLIEELLGSSGKSGSSV